MDTLTEFVDPDKVDSFFAYTKGKNKEERLTVFTTSGHKITLFGERAVNLAKKLELFVAADISFERHF